MRSCFVISPESVASQYCELEVAHAAQLTSGSCRCRFATLRMSQIPDEVRYRKLDSGGRERGRGPSRGGRRSRSPNGTSSTRR